MARSYSVVIGIFVFSAVGFIYVFRFTKLQDRRMCDGLIIVVGLFSVPLLLIVLETAEVRSLHANSLTVANTIEQHGDPDVNVFVYRDFEDVFSSLPFYL
jgi:hypothetical protein